MRAFLLGVLTLFLLGCAGIQTDPTCKVEQYGLITFFNNTDEYKDVYIYRVAHDGERYKTVGDGISRVLEPLTRVRIRIHPGMVLVVIDTVAGERWMRVFQISLCSADTTITMDNPVAFREIPTSIRSRRACEDCPCPPKVP